MRIFYTEADIEDLAASGVKQLELGPGVALTDAAKERAEELGIRLVKPGSAPAAARSATLPARPRGCQHGPLGGAVAAQGSQGTAAGSPVVEQLVDAVSALKESALKNRGG